MKRLIFVLALVLISSQVFARGLVDSYKKVKDTAIELVTPEECERKVCPPCAGDSFEDIERSDLDITIMFDMIDNPGEGSYQFHILDNYHIAVNYNLTSGFFAYGWLGQKKYKKTELADAIYGPDWSAISLFAGVGIYITPVISVHVGGGKMWLENEGGAPDTGVGVEYGVNYDIPWGNNKIVVSWKMVSAGNGEDDDDTKFTGAELQSNPSYTSLGIGLSIPFMR